MTRARDVLDPRPIVRITEHPDRPRSGGWPYTIAAVTQLLDHGLELDSSTILVGENGSGKSTILEAVAMAYGLNTEGGSTGARFSTWTSESSLHWNLRLVRGGGAARWGYFVRAETMHSLFTYLQTHDEPTDFHRRSHGEAFWDLLDSRRLSDGGLLVLDEPEAGLSFTAQLRLVALLHELGDLPGAQLLVATHSPILASVPNAQVIELDEEGFHHTTWGALATVDHYRTYLDDPEAYLRHLLS